MSHGNDIYGNIGWFLILLDPADEMPVLNRQLPKPCKGGESCAKIIHGHLYALFPDLPQLQVDEIKVIRKDGLIDTPTAKAMGFLGD
jgi:hypothetical protein